MTNKSVSMAMASSFAGESFESIDVDVSDSDSWQFIDPSDSDDGNFSYGDVTTTSDDEEIVSDVDDLLQHPYGSVSSDISMQSLEDEISRNCQELENTVGGVDGVLIDGEDDPYEVEGVESEEEDGEDLDLDDELVPNWLNNRFERQRIRKLGKKVSPKMLKSKRLANQYNKPGCVHGKHGLGMKHNLIC